MRLWASLVALAASRYVDPYINPTPPSESNNNNRNGLNGLTGRCNVLIIGGTRFVGAALWKELYDRGHQVTVYNRGKTPAKPVSPARETADDVINRVNAATVIQGDRKNAQDLEKLIDPSLYDYVFDMNARERSDVQPTVEIFSKDPRRLQQYVLMSSAGVYLPSDELPYFESARLDPLSRHRGKLDCEEVLAQSPLPWCCFRPTYICGPGNYNPTELFFLERVDAGRPVCIPGHGEHLTGLGHVDDLAKAMAQVIGRADITNRKAYNIQNVQAVSLTGIARSAGRVLGKTVEIATYNPDYFDFGDKKPFPIRAQHFFTSPLQAMVDLDWMPAFDTVDAILEDSYVNDYVYSKAAGKHKADFSTDDMVLQAVKQQTTA